MAKTRTHVVTGDRTQVLAALTRAHSEGRLVSVTSSQQLSGGRVQVVADLLAVRSGWEKARPWLTGAAKTGAVVVGLAGVGGLVWLLVLAVMVVVAWVVSAVAWVAAHVVGIIVCFWLTLFFLAWLFSAGDCAGIHCGGCRR
ncbi:MAG TPA: hypothetical protein VL595_30835 [Pseudonocardia sp.]|jgi:hypothetical protein|nr:hypothetical protein [Pseudonocardia sp.]